MDSAKKFITEMIRLPGFPKSIVFDRGKIFLSVFLCELFRLADTSLKFSIAFHPHADGQTEVLNRCLETYIYCLTSSHSCPWFRFVCWAEFLHNTSFHTSLKKTPFRVVNVRIPPSLLKYESGSTVNADFVKMLLERDDMLVDIHIHLVHAQKLMKNNAGKHRRDLEFQVGDLVYFKLRLYRQHSVVRWVPETIKQVFWSIRSIGEDWEGCLSSYFTTRGKDSLSFSCFSA